MDITLVYFIYGLAFFSMGLAMLMESNRTPLLAQSRVLRPLALFGFVHGTHEWLEMFLDKSDWLVFQDPLLVSWLRIGVLSLSFASLGLFAIRSLQPQRRLEQRERFLLIGAVGAYVLLIVVVAGLAWSRHVDRLSHVDAMLRYFVAVPAAFLAGVALYRQSTQARSQERKELSQMLRWAAWGFLIYTFTQAVVPPVDFYLARWINTETFTAAFGFPVQIVRAIMAGVITFSLIRATQIVDQERQREFLTAQQERLDALEKVQKELLHREEMREELLRHTVIAQEDERARIARELHDEMAQILTGFTLHLASLCKQACDDPQVRERVEYLQDLSEQLSASIYRLVHDLRPAQLDDLGLVPALKYLVEDLKSRIGLQANFIVEGEPQRLDPLVETVLFRGAQEGLTNVSRHAGVDHADLRLVFAQGQVRLTVDDKGVGLVIQDDQLPLQSWGLAGMRERAESVGGRLKIQSELGLGTLVEMVIPIEKEKEGINAAN
jgi:signal transduction histidine kinase